ncbi:hypothetical protein BDF20DRAFT_813157 [Mycotypha africana]|uniref:uncharacterized protein n=1 Tax=Mycotypha africana TaxID=64632 RepID=UPI0022FFC565|nr:uncharacterized protein BDF20DRAFT_813157 [Mycotypha africana]KAI8991537.1 hypothetical protein BDF20DRAFT_813157 [Mycotypha africana]
MSNNSNDIFEAAASGDLEYIKKNIKSIHNKNERGWTPLHFAARFGQLEVAQLLKQNKADLTIETDDGKTASQLATLWGQEPIAQLLSVPATSLTSVEDKAPTTFPFPDNYVAVFSGNPLNRFGWKRTDNGFLSRLAHSKRAKYMIFNNQQTIYTEKGNIQYVEYDDVASVVDRVYKNEDDTALENVTEVILVFLGLDESEGTGEEGGIAYWALDLTPKKGETEALFRSLIKGFEAKGWAFTSTLPHAYGMEKSETAIIAQAASMIDWNARNKFCVACGERTVLLEGGYKRSCPAGNACISHNSVQNFNYPRTGIVRQQTISGV